MTLVVENAEFISCVFGFCTLFVKAVLLQILTRLCDDKTEVSTNVVNAHYNIEELNYWGTLCFKQCSSLCLVKCTLWTGEWSHTNWKVPNSRKHKAYTIENLHLRSCEKYLAWKQIGLKPESGDTCVRGALVSWIGVAASLQKYLEYANTGTAK